MQLVANWRETLRHAWSVRLIVLAAILSGAEVIVPSLTGLPHGLLAVLSGVVSAAAFVARLIAQRRVSGDA